VAALRAALDERTSDLQRLKAEFDNYRKRVERDRVTVAEQAQAAVLAKLVPVLDDVDRARSHGEVTGGFKVVADALESTVEKLGLLRFGDEGDPFDPSEHEAVMHSESPDVVGPTCVSVMRSGYRFRDRLLRPAMVAVAEPPASEPPPSESAAADDEPQQTAD
jgi:molecular chaperone GrpE